ncbi:hypothetical protein SAMN05216474_0544 [Lishizhenia tianjinensis]|uniref:Uncharacterized protein n=1 Tax=Lishizhenia tianjinensis TaxID=477690 RepID=A0A1I6XZ52_9FLAO|nr:hypothetical protein [Lishizhenia tianjinensis]SFT43417.1 hypothetical protein SAMN05216474_0544 [Lishizhenia tianjinensis]
MKNRILILILLISNLSFGQQYDGLHIEKRKVDKNNRIYTLGKEFVFNIKITEDDSTLFLKENDSDNFKLTNNIDSLKISEIHLTMIKPRLFQRTNTKQTEVCYSYEPNPKIIAFTGIVENKENIWIHPPRSGFFKSLETCPFPYIKLNKPKGYKWTDSMSIGNHWSNEKWGKWDGRLLLNYRYEITGKEKLNCKLGEIDCFVINAVATSNSGKSKLKAYYSNKYGFIKLEYTLFTGIKVELELEKVVNGTILRDGKDFFESKYN